MRSSPRLSEACSRRHIIPVVVLLLVLSACSNIGTITGPSQAAHGPIQFYDTHGVFLCELHGQNPATDCQAPDAPIRQFAGQFLDYAINELADDLHVPTSKLPQTALNVSTTLDLALQKRILQHIQQYIATMATMHNMKNAAEVMLDYHNGAIRSFIGSLDPQVNILTRNARQAGQAFKPFVYATAFEQGISPGEVVYDAPFSIGQGSQAYSPIDYGRQYRGYISYRSALQDNANIPALKLYLKTGFAALRKTVIAMGIKPAAIGTEGYYALPLGTMELPLLDETVAYGTMADGGIHVPPHAIEKVSTADAHVIFTSTSQGTRALSPQTAFMMTDVMSDNNARASEFGQCSPLLLYTTTQTQCEAGHPGDVRPAAVHGGVTDAFRDTIMIGYTTDLVVGAWSGNSNAEPMFNILGVDGAARIWHDTMLMAEEQKPITAFPGPPAGVVKKTVSYPNLTTTDWYLAQ
jgi:membrane peptidoglycan carboxypeptidase